MSTTPMFLRAIVALLLALPSTALAQYEHGYADQTVNLAGPRFGVTVLSGGITRRLRDDHKISVNPVITQFGWQLEKQFKTGSNDVSALTELVALLGGMEQNVALPSVSWIVGARLKSGFEFGVGPNITPLSSAIVYVAGITHKVGTLNVPLNISIIPSVDGVRASVLTGFNLQTFDSWPLRTHTQRSTTPPSVHLPADIGLIRPRVAGRG